MSWTDSMPLENNKEINSSGKTTSNNNKDGAATPSNSRTGEKQLESEQLIDGGKLDRT